MTTRTKHFWLEAWDWIKNFLFIFIIAILIFKFVVINAVIPTGSMETTIMAGDRAIAFRLAYVFGEPKRSDIIIFKYPDDESVNYVKRVIGLPGETIEGRDGYIYINGEVLDEPYIQNEYNYNFGPYTVPEANYFMMGDNRDNSEDSRFWKNKFLDRDKIMGKVLFRYFPKIGFIK